MTTVTARAFVKLATAATLGLGLVAAPAAGAQAATQKATSTVNVRAGATVGAAKLGVLKKGQKVESTGASVRGWTPVTFRGKKAWISTKYLGSVQGRPPAKPTSGPRQAKAGAAKTSAKTAKVLAFAYAKRGTPYRYGATGPKAYDCSGFTQAAFRAAGVKIGRTTSVQLSRGTRVSPSKLKPGDIVGFYKGGHVGLYIGSGKVIHAPRTGSVVRIESMKYMPYYKAVRY